MSKDSGHLVMSMHLSSRDSNTAERITGGPTLIGHITLSADEQYLLLADVDMALIEKVRISDGEVSFVTKYGTPGFRPGESLKKIENSYNLHLTYSLTKNINW